MEKIIAIYPSPIAWALWQVKQADSRVARFHHLMEAAEDIVRYLALVHAARYIDLRKTRTDPGVDQVLVRLRRPSFGDVEAILARLEDHVAGLGAPLFGIRLNAPVEGQAMTGLCRKVAGSKKQKTSILNFYSDVVALRNQTKGHGKVTEAVALEYNDLLEQGIVDSLYRIPALCERPPVCIFKIEYRRKSQIEIHFVRLVGTAAPIPESKVARDPGILEQDLVYLWGAAGDAPVQLSPFLHYDRLTDSLFLLSGISSGIPEYQSRGSRVLEHRPDNLQELFRECAGFLLEIPSSPTTAAAPADAAKKYERAVARAMEDGVVSRDEEGLLEILASSLGLSGDEARAVHDRVGAKFQEAAAPGSGPVKEMPPAAPAREDVPAPSPIPEPPSSPPPAPGPHGRERARARELDLADDLDGAIAMYRDILQEDPRDEQTRADLTELLLDVGDTGEAERLCREGLDIAPSSATVLAALAFVLLESHRVTEAFQKAQLAHQADPGSPLACRALAACHDEAGEFRSEMNVLELGLERNPGDPRLSAANAQASMTCRRRNPLDVVREIETILRRAPRDRDLALSLAGSLTAASRWRDARKALEDLAARNRRNLKTRGLLSFALALTNRCDEALALSEAVLSVNPQSMWALLTKTHLTMRLTGKKSLIEDSLRTLERIAARSTMKRYFLASVLSGCGDSLAAAHEFHAILSLNPDFDLARLELADVHVDQGRLPEAEAEIQKILATFPKDPEALFKLGYVRLNQGNLEEAERILESLGADESALLFKALLHYNRGQLREAEGLLRRVLEQNESDPEALSWLAKVCCDLGKPEAAEILYPEKWIPAWLRVELASSWGTKGNVEKAKAYLEAVRDRDDLGESQYDQCYWTADGAGLQDLKKHFAEKGVERHRESAVLYFNLGRYAYDSGDRDRALEMYRTSLDLDPSQTLAWNSVGIIEMDLGQYEGALESFKKVLAIEESPVYLHNATNCLVNLRRFDEAMAYAEKGLQKDGSEEYCDSMAGLFRGLGRWEEAERIVAKGLEAHPLSKELGRTQAAILSATGDVAGAVALLREIDLKNPGDAGVLFDLAGLLENSGRIAQAEALHKRAMKADPRNRYLGLAYGKFLVRQGQLPKADRVFRDLLQASPSPDPDAAEEILDHWLTAYGESGKNREGLALLDGLEPEFPGLSLFPLFRGLFLKANGEIEKAMEFFEKGLDTMPRLVLHIVECLQKMGRHAECVERMDEVLEKDPDWVDGRVKLVEILLECGELEWAEDEIARLSTRPVSETLLEDLRSRLEEKRLGSQEN